ncbi:lysophospholipid acyltransferase family protein [Desulfitobacterium metallireducens]|uniref:1-acyl-sn-glycerol-3-phosphate acyltransferase n=1 Tax=Desulfitobacterium metallireducens DSM 15288 TaxID=871968 RepID=W0EDL9_9FIRM|nr:lysophospholipid acyltransferase family protein [Desulfitobacterium metallireducens]AHF07284.1 1-acyl-sn-glycerol-3-phosphate acyltransferase [Desulfitobacterium metallireducens DSM 15288]
MTLYSFARGMFRLQFKVMGWKIRGVENLPSEGPVILAINHVSLWDPIVAACSISRPVAFMAKEELFRVPFLGPIVRRLGAFPVKRGQGDTSAIRQSLKVLKEGRVLGLFPEGTRSKTGELQKGLPGAALLMDKGKATVLPIRVSGTKQLLTKGWGKLEVVMGEPLTSERMKTPEGVEDRREWLTEQIMKALASLDD